MYLKKRLDKKTGDVYLSIMEKYYVPKIGARERTYKSLGYVSELKKEFEDPISYFTQYAKDLTIKKKEDKSINVPIDIEASMPIGTNVERNVGYCVLKNLYKELEIDKFWNWKTKGRRMKFNTDQIMKLLTFSRALNPGSKRFTLNNKDFFFEPFNGISIDGIYHSLDIIANNKDDLQAWIYSHSKKICERDMSVSYFDCTNYYFDISHPDVDEFDDDGNPVDKNGRKTEIKYRKRGPEKNNRPDPIIEMGLLMDRNGIPLAFNLFPGNESEKTHMLPIIDRVKERFSTKRVIVVADRGLNTSDNIYWLNGDNKKEHNRRDGYVYGQSIRGADAEFKDWVLSGGYTTSKIVDESGTKIVFKHKSRLKLKTLHVNVSVPGQNKTCKKNVTVDQKQMVYYSEKYAKKQKKDREAMIARAKDLILHPSKYDRITAKGSASYVLNIAFDKNTGEIVKRNNLELDNKKIEEEEKYDGYYSIVTSELNMSDLDMRKIYRGLAKIEDTFKVTKSYFDSRPIYMRTNKHIEAHFTTCFLGLVLMRLLEKKLGNRFYAGRIIEALKKYTCIKIHTNIWQFIYYNEIIDACAKAFNIQLNMQYRKQQDIQRILHY